MCSRLFLPGEREVASLTAQQVRRLQDDGFVVVDGFLEAAAAAALRREALRLHSAGIPLHCSAIHGGAMTHTNESDHLPSIPSMSAAAECSMRRGGGMGRATSCRSMR